MTSRARLVATALLGLALPAAPRAGDEMPPLMILSERTEDGKLVAYPASSVVDVDVNSSALVRLSPQALATLSRIEPGRGEERARVVQQLKDLAALQQKLNAAALEVLGAARVRAASHAQGIALAGEALERYRHAHEQLAKAYEALRGYMGEKQHDALVAAALEAEQDQTLAAARFVAEEHRRLQDRVQDDLEETPGRVLTITASIGDPPRQMHVPGYDDLATGPARNVEKTRFTFDERFAQEYAAAKVLAREAADWNKLRAAALEAVQRKLGELHDQLDSFAKQAKALASQAEHDPRTEVQQAAAELEKAARKLGDAFQAASPALKSAIKPPAGADPAELLAGALGALQKISPAVRDAAGALVSAFNTLQKGKAAIATSAEKLATDVAELAARALGASVAAKPPVAAPQLSGTKVKLAEARDTEISLLVTDRADGDVVTISTRVLDAAPEGDTPIAGGEMTRYLRVRSRGFVADTGAVVLFTRPMHHDPGPFIPAAGAYAVFRYKGWRSDGQANSNFWYYAAPGLGVSAVAIPRSSDGATQIAWMGTFHLFGDVLQASLGTTTDAAPVWGIGIGLHRIAGLGKYFQ